MSIKEITLDDDVFDDLKVGDLIVEWWSERDTNGQRVRISIDEDGWTSEFPMLVMGSHRCDETYDTQASTIFSVMHATGRVGFIKGTYFFKNEMIKILTRD